jgi:large subunit ribosomal protein L33
MAGKKKSVKKKLKTILVRLVSTASPYFYTTRKNPKMEGGHNGKLRLKKFDPNTRKHEWFEEKKIK